MPPSSSGDRAAVAMPGARRPWGAWLRDQLELGRTGAVSNLQSMEGLRGLAVFLVFLVHYMSLVSPWVSRTPGLSQVAETVHALGNVGVDLFFVLSGFLIYGALIAREQAFLPFIGRRVRRIYPAFLAVFALYVLLSWAMPQVSKIPPEPGAAALYLLQNLLLLPGLFPIEPLITVAWSLSYEFFYYLMVPVFVVLLGLRRRAPMTRLLGAALLGLFMAAGFALLGGPVRLLMFVAGILLYEAQAMKQLRAPGGAAGTAALLAGLALTLVPLPGAAGQALKFTLLGLCFFVLCWAAFGHPRSGLARALSLDPLRWLGNMSYSYYLIHGLSLQAFFKVLEQLPVPHGGLLFWAALPLSFAASLIPSLLLFLLVERPFSLAGEKKPAAR